MLIYFYRDCQLKRMCIGAWGRIEYRALLRGLSLERIVREACRPDHARLGVR